MKLSVSGESAVERLAIALGLAPVPLVETHMSFLRARAIMVGTKLGVFEALADGPLASDAIAGRCGTSTVATPKLLHALVASGYLRADGGEYALTSRARTWLLADSPRSMRDKVLFEFFEWTIVEGTEAFVRTGRAQDLHLSGDEERWAAYQRAMRVLSRLAAPEIVRRTPLPRGATRMLDVGGSHGFIPVAMCRRHRALSAVVLDLPAAVRHAAPLLAAEGMGDRVVHLEGDARVDDLGTGRVGFDLYLTASASLRRRDQPRTHAACGQSPQTGRLRGGCGAGAARRAGWIGAGGRAARPVFRPHQPVGHLVE